MAKARRASTTEQPRSPSVKDVATRAGVSLGTVSNFLNKPEVVSPTTQAKVRQAMADLGFVRNEFARQLRTGASRVFAYVMLDARNPFFTDVAQGAELATSDHDFSLYLCNSSGRRERELYYLDSLLQQRVQGIMITPVEPESEALTDVLRRGVPLVVVDRTRRREDACTVSVDDTLGGRLAVEHLVDLGHTQVALVGGPSELGQVRDRFAGARAAWSDAGLDQADLVLVETSAMTVEEGLVAGQRLAGRSAARRPTAAFCANDLLALGLLQHAVLHGLQVPGDLSLVGYDDIDFAAAAAVPLTSVRQPRTLLGRTAAELLFSEAHDPDHQHRQVRYDPELVVRSSTGSAT